MSGPVNGALVGLGDVVGVARAHGLPLPFRWPLPGPTDGDSQVSRLARLGRPNPVSAVLAAADVAEPAPDVVPQVAGVLGGLAAAAVRLTVDVAVGSDRVRSWFGLSPEAVVQVSTAGGASVEVVAAGPDALGRLLARCAHVRTRGPGRLRVLVAAGPTAPVRVVRWTRRGDDWWAPDRTRVPADLGADVAPLLARAALGGAA